MSLRIWPLTAALVLAPAVLSASQAQDNAEKAQAVSDQNGMYFDAEGNPTFKILDGGVVDWYTFSGYRRYHADCHVCHGPDGMGSTYAPPLIDSMKSIDYANFLAIVAEGIQDVGAGKESVMPGFGDNKNVYCYLDDLYIYLRARSVGGIPRGRPPKKADKPEAAKDHEDACMSG
ncbi:c-type cytochrome, methanol metabolism-related [Mesorhizobium xinjiangense]|uniref:c-type cytochrome, methanol metabolism-related n=1 Tax=Mesorhizobium xinjiangense TaxID=2678685 RepID=UPI0012EDC0E7|nr:c-type cytochrome, methanol metabolism-related [Mesorhizobium xinjiangense]